MGASRSVVADEGSRQPEGDTADRVLRFIRENPSTHLRQIKKELGLAMGTIQYQLDRLEKAGRISSTSRSVRPSRRVSRTWSSGCTRRRSTKRPRACASSNSRSVSPQ